MTDKPKLVDIKEYRDSNLCVYDRLHDDLLETIKRYNGEVRVVEVIGVLALIADEVKTW